MSEQLFIAISKAVEHATEELKGKIYEIFGQAQLSQEQPKSAAKPCKKCGAPITFRAAENDKWDVLDPDGGLHYKTCSGR